MMAKIKGKLYPYRVISFDRPDTGLTNFFVRAKSGVFDGMSFDQLNRYFEEAFIQEQAYDIVTKGGRGQTLLFTLPNEWVSLLYAPKKDKELSTLDADDKAAMRSFFPLCRRDYLRGGLIGKFIKRSFLKSSRFAHRARKEFELLNHLYDKSLPVPRALLAKEKVGIFTIENSILIEQIPESKNLEEIMSERALSESEIRTIAQTLVLFWRQKLIHTDLNIRNILIDKDEKCYLIDFDKCYIKKRFNIGDAENMLKRLDRSFTKELTLNSKLHFKHEDFRSLQEQALKIYTNAQSQD